MARPRLGAQATIKRALIRKPTTPTDKLIDMLKRKGIAVTSSAVSTIRSGTLETLRIVKELGVPKGNF